MALRAQSKGMSIACLCMKSPVRECTFWGYVFQCLGASDALARRLYSESPPMYVPSTIVRNPSNQECTGFIACVLKSRAAARRFYRNRLQNSRNYNNSDTLLQIFTNPKTARRWDAAQTWQFSSCFTSKLRHVRIDVMHNWVLSCAETIVFTMSGSS